MREALNAIAGAAPDWLRELAPLEWFDRYGRRIEEARLPTKPEERQQYAEVIAVDGLALLEAVYAAEAPAGLRELEAVQILRRVWVHQYETVDGQLRWRDPKNSPPPAIRLDTRYEPEARYATKGPLKNKFPESSVSEKRGSAAEWYSSRSGKRRGARG